LGIVTLVRLVLLKKVESPISVTLLGIVTLRQVQLMKARFPIVVTLYSTPPLLILDGISTSASTPVYLVTVAVWLSSFNKKEKLSKAT
jgi:hypothetical protein